jgi:hypothetical protein
MKDCTSTCVCNDPGSLLIPKRSLSACIALFCITLMGIFSAGYFLGKHTAIKEFADQLHNQAFSDQISQALQTFFNKVPAQITLNDTAEADSVSPVAPIATPEPVSVHEQGEQVPGQYHRALLFGGKRTDVEELVERLQGKGFPVVVRCVVSKNDKGKTIKWYQAVTEPLANRTELLHIVDQIKKHARLSNVQYDIVKI